MITRLDSRIDDVAAVLQKRTVQQNDQVREAVSEIIEDVRQRGDAALLDSARRFDAPGLTRLVSDPSDWEQVSIPAGVQAALERALLQIQRFHSEQFHALTEGWRASEFESVEVRRRDGQPLHLLGNFQYTWQKPPLRRQGWVNHPTEGAIGQRMIPVQRAGVYVPGGQAAYPSSVLMNVIPAQCVGVNSVVVTTPVRTDGTLHPAVQAALALAGVTRAVCVGGAAAIAGLALGTESLPRVDVIVGPGNRYVNEAKRQLWGQVGLDGYAGPSEVAVLVDGSSRADWAAADLLTQIEHAPDNAGFLISTDRAKLEEVLREVEVQLTDAPRRRILEAALQDHSVAILVQDEAEACEVVNAIAPEHLTIATRDPERLMGRIRNAGCILLGEWSPESAGDFAAGPSHTLPTSGGARFGSPVNVLTFLKLQSLISLSRSDLEDLLPTIEAFGQMEGFPAHARGARVRFEGRD